MGPPEAVDREFVYIDFFFCFFFGSRALFFLPSVQRAGAGACVMCSPFCACFD